MDSGEANERRDAELPAILERDVRALARPEGRMVGTSGHAAARSFLARRLERLGLEPYAESAGAPHRSQEGDAGRRDARERRGSARFELPYRFGAATFVNLVGVAPGRNPAPEAILLGAHYDTAGPWAGADDNAAAVAIALAVAARLVREPAARDVAVALFDAEEPPYFHTSRMGSTYFQSRQQRVRMHAAVILDLVGHAVPIPGAEDVLFATGMESDPGLRATIETAPDLDRMRLVTALNRYVGDMSDHHAYRLARTPYLFLTCGRWEHYHLPTDTPEKLDYAKMASIARFVEHVVRDASERTLDGPWEGYDTTETDLRLMRQSLGGVAGALGVRLESRSDIERLAALLMARFRV